ncbi:hypothetical protein NEP08_26335 [Escherichia coli]|nr:hypothetical protein [Escherichia coli]APJ80150.1 hypothetical protein RG28_28400 [Escherichia coli]KXR78888.1 hypothetical protein AUQ29_21780 [Escherichia coli]MCV8901956.1 hypothetical protein [Escherichia coli]MDI0673662.1 hypothetical protein [Escherichia coli]MDI1091235.1 hypothetical protein [Escherichia coli]
MENKECSCKDDVRNPGAGMGMTLLVLCLVYESVPASSKRLQISLWGAEGYALHLLIIAVMVNGLQMQA